VKKVVRMAENGEVACNRCFRPRILRPCPQLNTRSTSQQDKKHPTLVHLPVMRHIVSNVIRKGHVQKDNLMDPTCNVQKLRKILDELGQQAGWTLDDEGEKKLRKIFDEMDLDKNKMLSKEERTSGKQLKSFLNDHGVDGLLQTLQEKIGDVTFEGLKHKVEKERELARKSQALNSDSMNLLRVIAETIPGGSLDKPLLALELMKPTQISHLCRFVLARELEAAMIKYHEQAKQKPATLTIRDEEADEYGGNMKFALQEAVFGPIEDYHKGIISSLGYPNTDLMNAMKQEHCQRPDSKDLFKPGNYQLVETCPEE
jgi:hypothetical protein